MTRPWWWRRATNWRWPELSPGWSVTRPCGGSSESAREVYEARLSADRFTASLAAPYAELGVYA